MRRRPSRLGRVTPIACADVRRRRRELCVSARRGLELACPGQSHTPLHRAPGDARLGMRPRAMFGSVTRTHLAGVELAPGRSTCRPGRRSPAPCPRTALSAACAGGVAATMLIFSGRTATQTVASRRRADAVTRRRSAPPSSSRLDAHVVRLVLDHAALEHVHRADEVGDEARGRELVDLRAACRPARSRRGS